MDKRKHMGKDKDGVIFPVAPNLSEMGDSYLQFIEEIKKEILKQDKDKVNEIGGKFIREVIEGNFHPDQIKEYTIRFSMGIAKEDTSGKTEVRKDSIL